MSVPATPSANPTVAVNTYPHVSDERMNAPYSVCALEISDPEKTPIAANNEVNEMQTDAAKRFFTFLSCFCRINLLRRFISLSAFSVVYFMISSLIITTSILLMAFLCVFTHNLM